MLLFVLGIGLRSQAANVVLTSDRQLNDLLNPDQKIDLSTGRNVRFASLREVCEEAQRKGDKVLTIAFDEFFRQYRQQAGTERRLRPDMDEYIDKIKTIGDFAAHYHLGIGLSLLSPLELGSAFRENTGESGRWFSYKVGYRDPSSGKFSFQMWQQLAWTNNKGKFAVRLKGVRAFAFHESRIGHSPLKAVAPGEIREIQGVHFEALDTQKITPHGELWSDSAAAPSGSPVFEIRNLRVFGDGGDTLLRGDDRVLVVLEYETSEMDYFSAKAAPFLKTLLTKYHDKGIDLMSLYSDEMHIQQDWFYFIHHENGQFNLRYLTPSFSVAYRKAFGQELEVKDLLYFAYGAPTFETGANAVRNVQYVMGEKTADIQRTFLLRDRYYKMLNDSVVDLFKEAKNYAESLYGRRLTAQGHATWAESPTIDLWDTETLRENAAKYEYTSNYVWGNTVQQASAACYDYFKWGEYLEPTGVDFAECGWLDRDYYGAAMGASLGVVNRIPNAYIAAWGMPAESKKRKVATDQAFGAADKSTTNLLTGGVHRDIETLILYPRSLVAVEERFGSWMTQYAYANYLTADKLLAMGQITADGRLRVGEKTYRTLVAVFEPLPAAGLLDLMDRFTAKGGKVIWCGPPPMLDGKGEDCRAQWRRLFGVNYTFGPSMGEIAAGRKVRFQGSLATVSEQTILTDFLVDRIYPVDPETRCEVLAKSGDKILGVKTGNGRGAAYYFGFRPRDDQSASLGYETRTMFEILNACGAYPGSERFPGIDDNPTVISRTTDYLATRFPNGSTVIARHYRTHAESWDVGFSRDKESDDKALALNPMPSDAIALQGLKVNGHELTYQGRLLLAFRTDPANRLIAFEGHQCRAITLDGRRFEFAQIPFATIAFAPEPGGNGDYFAVLSGEGRVLLPNPFPAGKTPRVVGPGNRELACRNENGQIELQVTPAFSGKRLTMTVSERP